MSTHFHDPLLKEAYKAREATGSWRDKMLEFVQPEGWQVLDAGCGGEFIREPGPISVPSK
ncbi:hypothetical protein ACLMAB_12305 [Brevibacillus laterosporus]